MPLFRTFLLGFLAALVLHLQPAFGQRNRIDLRVNGGYSYLLEKSLPNTWLGGGAVTAAVWPGVRLGVEVLRADVFGQDQENAEGGLLISPIMERSFLELPRVKPYLVGGVSFLRRRSKNSVGLGGGLGVRLFVTRHLFLAPEVRFGNFPRVRSTVSVGIAF